MTAEIWRRGRTARQAIRRGFNLTQFGSTLFFRVRQNNRLFLSLSLNLQPWFKVWLGCFLPWVHKISHWGVIFCTGSHCWNPLRWGQGCRCYYGTRSAFPPPPNDCLSPPHFDSLRMFFGASRNDKTTGNNGKRNNIFQTWFSFEVFSIVCKIAGHQLLYINVTQ